MPRTDRAKAPSPVSSSFKPSSAKPEVRAFARELRRALREGQLVLQVDASKLVDDTSRSAFEASSLFRAAANAFSSLDDVAQRQALLAWVRRTLKGVRQEIQVTNGQLPTVPTRRRLRTEARFEKLCAYMVADTRLSALDRNRNLSQSRLEDRYT